jgi:stress response protein SCP2
MMDDNDDGDGDGDDDAFMRCHLSTVDCSDSIIPAVRKSVVGFREQNLGNYKDIKEIVMKKIKV